MTFPLTNKISMEFIARLAKTSGLAMGCLISLSCLLNGQLEAKAQSINAALQNRPLNYQSPLESFLLPALDPNKFLPEINNVKLILDLSDRRVYVWKDEKVVASYPVAVGKEGWETPKGNFKVIQLIENPVWEDPWTGEVHKPGPNTALGLRWIGFWSNGKDTIGFHGTPTINSIGQAASHGCVRMRNEDILEMFNKVQMGTPVNVVD